MSPWDFYLALFLNYFIERGSKDASWLLRSHRQLGLAALLHSAAKQLPAALFKAPGRSKKRVKDCSKMEPRRCSRSAKNRICCSTGFPSPAALLRGQGCSVAASWPAIRALEWQQLLLQQAGSSCCSVLPVLQQTVSRAGDAASIFYFRGAFAHGPAWGSLKSILKEKTPVFAAVSAAAASAAAQQSARVPSAQQSLSPPPQRLQKQILKSFQKLFVCV